LNVSSYGYVIENGEIALHGPADKLKQDQKIDEAYLGV
jgi:branched-chain amino acid transport system ATP-binding protein